MLQRMLVGLDGSALAETILPYVTTLARALGAEVTLLQVLHLPEDVRSMEPHATLEQVLERAEVQSKDYLHKIEARLRTDGLQVKSAVAIGDAPAEIVGYARREAMDVIALATHGRSGLKRLMYGSVADEVLHTTRTPLLLIHPSTDHSSAPRTMSEIVVPLDGSPLAEMVLPYAEALAKAINAPITLIRAVETVYIYSEPTAGAAAGYQEILDAMKEAAETYLGQIAGDLRGKGFSVNMAVPTGFPASEVEDYAQDHPGSLVVMATHGRTGVVGLLMGSVARRIVQTVGTPILLVRPLPPAGAPPR